MANLPLNSINKQLYPSPLAIITAAIAELRSTAISDRDLAIYISDCLSAALKTNDLIIMACDGSQSLWRLAFEKAENDRPRR